MIRHVGRGLRWTALGHGVIGLWLHADPVLATLQDGLVAAVDPHPDRELAFWFLLYSPVLWILGDVFDQAIALGEFPLLRRLVGVVFGMGLVGAAMMPISGFWILLGLGTIAGIGLQKPSQGTGLAP